MKKRNLLLLKTVMISAITSLVFSMIFYSPIIYFIIKNEQESQKMVKEFIDGREQRQKALDTEVVEKLNCYKIKKSSAECNI